MDPHGAGLPHGVGEPAAAGRTAGPGAPHRPRRGLAYGRRAVRRRRTRWSGGARAIRDSEQRHSLKGRRLTSLRHPFRNHRTGDFQPDAGR
ncbi:hypothetical protein E4P36_08390 [Streptomyces sp. 4R-3d]|nr:hypothetical protein E4P36_08390 [Streptomyces sp. 4R-3d]